MAQVYARIFCCCCSTLLFTSGVYILGSAEKLFLSFLTHLAPHNNRSLKRGWREERGGRGKWESLKGKEKRANSNILSDWIRVMTQFIYLKNLCAWARKGAFGIYLTAGSAEDIPAPILCGRSCCLASFSSFPRRGSC